MTARHLKKGWDCCTGAPEVTIAGGYCQSSWLFSLEVSHRREGMGCSSFQSFDKEAGGSGWTDRNRKAWNHCIPVSETHLPTFTQGQKKPPRVGEGQVTWVISCKLSNNLSMPFYLRFCYSFVTRQAAPVLNSATKSSVCGKGELGWSRRLNYADSKWTEKVFRRQHLSLFFLKWSVPS